MTKFYPRNWQGYCNKPPQINWPDGIRLAVNIMINVEEGAERNILDGDSQSENLFSGFSALPAVQAGRHYSSETMYAYGARSGIWRLFNLLEEFQIPATFLCCGQALERNPALTSALATSAHDIMGHGWRWIDYAAMDKEQERRHIQSTLEIIRSSTGKEAVGWYTGRKSPNTRELIIEAGLKYDSDDYSDDFPFWIPAESGHHLIIPYTLINNDVQYCLSPGWNSPQTALDHLIMTFDALYRESQQQPMMMTIGLHSRLSGQPGRSEAIRRFIEYVQQFEYADFITREMIASTCHEQLKP